jgi:hypothetical protein
MSFLETIGQDTYFALARKNPSNGVNPSTMFKKLLMHDSRHRKSGKKPANGMTKKTILHLPKTYDI